MDLQTPENFVLFSDDMDGPKLQWFKAQLQAIHANYRIRGIGIKGKPLLEVDWNDFMAAVQILNQEVGSLMIGGMPLTWRDLPDNHESFVEALTDGAKPVLVTGNKQALPGMGDVYMYDVDSSNVSAIGMFKENDKVCAIVRYKGGGHYRYYPVPEPTWVILFTEVKQKTTGDPKASVGSLVNRLLKADKTIKCDKLSDAGKWERV